MKVIVVLLLALLFTVAAVQAGELVKKTTLQGDCSVKAKAGDQIKVHYVGKLLDGTEFDSSLTRGQPIAIKLGAGQVIKGWDTGLEGMCLGEERTLTIPSELGYGKRGAGQKIPPDATLVFDTKMVSINGKSATLESNKN